MAFFLEWVCLHHRCRGVLDSLFSLQIVPSLVGGIWFRTRCGAHLHASIEPSHKRGPPKGYLSALEQRLHDAEALLGAIISSNDSRATTLVTDLSKDSLASSIITRVTNSSFGPVGRNALRHRDSNANSRRRSINLRQEGTTDQEAPLIDGNGKPHFRRFCHLMSDSAQAT
jgi:hypothetical protein